MKLSGSMLSALSLFALLAAGGCATQRPPTIAHTHIGHALTGWVDTPHQEGLLVAAEDSAHAAVKAAEQAVANGDDLGQIKARVGDAVKATDPTDEFADPQESMAPYGVRNALVGVVNHLSYAAASADASANVKAGAEQFGRDATGVLDRCALISALGRDILSLQSRDDALALSGELLRLTRANVSGDDSDHDGVVGSTPEEYGLKQLRDEIEAMIKREDPPYRTVDSWYLFNLVRLPSGEWIFRRLFPGSSGGGYGGY